MPPEGYSTGNVRRTSPAESDVWTDGSPVRDEASGACFGFAGVYAHVTGSALLFVFGSFWLAWSTTGCPVLSSTLELDTGTGITFSLILFFSSPIIT